MKIKKDIYIDIDKKTFFLGTINIDVELNNNIQENDERILKDIKNNFIAELLNNNIQKLDEVLLEILNSFDYSGEIDTILSIQKEGNNRKIFITLSKDIKNIEIFSENIEEETDKEIIDMFIRIINDDDSKNILNMLSLQIFSNIKKQDDIKNILENKNYNILENIYKNLQGITSIK